MSKPTRQFLVLVTGLVLAVAVVPVGQVSSAGQPQKGNVTANISRNAAIVATTTEVLKDTSEIRELSILRPVKSGAQSRSEIERMLTRNLEEQMSVADMHATEVSLKKFGLAPADFQYRQFILKLLLEQVAGYYDPKMKEFHLADWLELEGQKPVMAHELTHALQDQHFNLRRFEKWPHGDSDAELAAHALVEGDATLAMTIYMARNPLVALAFSRSLMTGVSTEQYDQAPRAMRESLIFPYLQGSEWATQLYRKGGWAMVSNAFTKLPLSSEQILHPEKYFNYERPVKIELPDLTALLNQSAVGSRESTSNKSQSAISNEHSANRSRRLSTAHRPLPTAAWHRIESDVSGEWSYYLILDQFLNSASESKRAAAGWAGDRYALYEGPENQVVLVQVAAWDTENDAREFFDAYVKRTQLRYPGATQLDSDKTADSKLATRDLRSWQTNEGGVKIELKGSRVFILEGVPQGANGDELLNALN
ncbi:MAG TPA: hypothetical protein VLL54_05910 [Pyrinomonadaceae bacterium]|nr:hypothetical protein [Pyrinomonadaceae bacterium]